MQKCLILLLATGFFLSAAPGRVVAQNLLGNGGVEDNWTCNNPTDCYPGGWTKFGSIWWQQETYVKHSGNYSLKLSGTNNYANGGSGGHYQTVSVVPGGRYVVSGHSYRFYGKSADSVGIQFGSGGIAWFALYGLHRTQEWYRFSIQTDIPAGINTMTVYLKGEDNPFDGDQIPNDVYFDDISVDLISLPSLPLTATLSGPSVAANGDDLKFIGVGKGGTNTISSGGIYIAKLDNNNNPVPTSLSWCLNPANETWCRIYQQSFTDNQVTKSFGDDTIWRSLTPGNYLVVVNAADSGGRKCGGSPYGLPAGWTDCDPSGKDTIALTVGCARPNPPTNLRPTGLTIMAPQGMTYTGPLLTWDYSNNIAYPDTVSYNIWVNDLTSGMSSSCGSVNVGDLCQVNTTFSPYQYFRFGLGRQYSWWIQSVNSCGGVASEPISTNVTIPAYPVISSLQVSNSSSSQTGGFAGTYKTSGLQSTEGGSNWLNPINITLQATAWNGINTSNYIKQYFVAFYDKKEGTSSIQPAYTSIIADPATSDPNAQLKNLLSNNPAAGFLLAYDTASSKHYVWDPTSSNANKWVNISGLASGKNICGPAGCATQSYYTVFPGNTLGNPPNPNLPNSWDILLYKNFSSKTMYTAGYVTDNNLTTYQPDINPQ